MQRNPWIQRIKDHRKAFRAWRSESKEIVDRYRLERTIGSTAAYGDDAVAMHSYNILWSVIQTMKPVVFSRAPKVVSERRHKDKDPIGRLAAETVERAADYQLEVSGFADSMNAVVLDALLLGRGVPWVRFEADQGGGNHRIYVDYVHWSDFAHALEMSWADIMRDGWVARRTTMNRKAGQRRFGAEFDKVPAMSYVDDEDDARQSYGGRQSETEERDMVEVWEIWDRASRKRIMVAEGLQAELEEKDDPYQLQDFFPCPKPAFGTLTNEDLIPTPDYLQFRKLAQELDEVSERIRNLTRSLKLAGFYDASVEGIGRMLEADDGVLVPVTGLAGVNAKGGTENLVQYMPVRDVGEALQGLYASRESIKDVIYDVSGISDVVRGQVDPREKATQSKIKAQYAQSRIDQRRRAVERCARDTVRIMVEMMVEHLDPQHLRQQSGYDFQTEIVQIKRKHQQAVQQHQQAMQAFQQFQNQAMQGRVPPGPQGQPQQAPQHPGPPPQDPVESAWMQVVQLLRQDKMRDFRLDIETDSTIEMNSEAQQEERNQFLEASGGFLKNGVEVIQAAPTMARPIAELLLFAVRSHRAGRGLEQTFEDANDALQQHVEKQMKQAEQGPPPDPKAQAEAQRIQAQTQNEQAKAQADMQRTQVEGQIAQQKAQADVQIGQAKVQVEAQKVQVEQQKGQVELQKAQIEVAKMQIELQKAQLDLQIKQAQLEQAEVGIQSQQMQAQAQQQAADAKLDMQATQHDAAMQKMDLEGQASEQKMRHADAAADQQRKLADKKAEQPPGGSNA